ncbi:MAG: carboxynorspermidine decarboxylase [Bacteroidaceae bacterium]|nr:carboxynorspermidine decarboxylase [Bacteroidaceae bacterium]
MNISEISESDYARFPSPCYVVEENLLRRNLSLIQHVAEEADVEIILAFKAFALWKTFPIFREYISHTTASSLYEARLAFEEFGSPAHTYSPAYVEKEFPDILRCSSHLTFNSLSQYERFYPLAKQSGVSLGIRINPEYSEIETELYNPCAPGSRFGVLASQLPEVLPEGIEGFHCHCHCESSSEALEHTLFHLEEKFGHWLPKLKWLNLGGGLLMTRADYDVPRLVRILKGLHARYPQLHIILEPGSAFAWQTGSLISQVVDIVENKGIQTAILNVSFTCHMPDCLEMPYHPAVRGAQIVEDVKLSNSPFLYRLGGNSCLSGDYMGYWAFDHPLKIGEYIVLEDMIHYTTVKTTMFNGIHHPSLAILRADHSIEVLRTYTYEDYRDRMD